MPELRSAMNSFLAIIALGVTPISHATGDDMQLREDLQRIAQRRIFFGHQSVGTNLLDGIKQLSTVAGVPISIDKVNAASDVKQAMIGHTLIPENGNPLKKIKSFDNTMGLQPSGLDIALMKFCYVDFTAETNVKELFASYRETIEALKAKNPGTTFVHVTAPLTVVQSGIKARVKKLLGNAPYGVLENMRREEYNSLLRKEYQGRAPIFDLARIESTAPDGKTETSEWNNQVIPALVPSYSDDGGHLNNTGKLHAARELISVLAAIPDKARIGKTKH